MTTQTWTTLKQTVAIALTQQSGLDLTTYGATFEAQFPQATSYAENRIHREIPMLSERETDVLAPATTAGSRSIDLTLLSSGNVPLVVEQVMLITPAGMTSGTQVPYDLVSLDFLNRYWPTEATTVTPSLTYQGGRYFAMDGYATIALAPTPDDAYSASIVSLIQQAPISADNPTTYLSTYYPELLEAGCCVFLTGALTRNFGAQQDEPQSAMSWETQFSKLLSAARDEERRRRGLIPNMPHGEAPQAVAA